MTKLLKIGDHAAFKCYQEKQIVMGKVIAITRNCYLVAGDCGIVCSTYKDGMFRFTDVSVIREDRSLSMTESSNGS